METRIFGSRAISEEAFKAKTGKSPKQWGAILDRWDAIGNGHSKTARYLREEYELSPWWAQVVTARYEWERGVKVTQKGRAK